MRAKLGEGMLEILREKQRQIYKGWKRDMVSITAHYKSEYEIMQAKRADGVQGRIEFMSW